MKQRTFVAVWLGLFLAYVAGAETAGNAPWVGVWQGQLDGQPGVILTLADESGALCGTVVLNMVIREGGQAHVMASEPHLLLHPQLKGDVLSFHVTRTKDAHDVELAATLQADGNLQLRCTNCDGGGPVTELVKVRYTE